MTGVDAIFTGKVSKVNYDPRHLEHRKWLASYIRALLLTKKFVQINQSSQIEEIWEFKTSHPKITIRVFTSIVEGTMREEGQDAIRVCAVYKRDDCKIKGLVSETRVNRKGTYGDIGDRMLSRLRDCYQKVNKVGRCMRCGSPLFVSRKKNYVCVETCYAQRTTQRI